MESITVDELKAKLAAHPATPVVDVRESHEHATGVVPGVILLPMSEITARFAELAEHKAEVYVICQSGVRSVSVCGFLEERGFATVNVAGGTGGWERAGYPLAAPTP